MNSNIYAFKKLLKTQIFIKLIQGRIRLLLYQNNSSSFVYGPINANNIIKRTQIFHKVKKGLQCHFYVMDNFNLFFFYQKNVFTFVVTQ